MPNKSDKKKGLTTSHKLLSEDYKQQTEAIRSSEARFRTMVDSLPFDVFLIGSDGRYVLQNAPCRNSWGDIIGKRPEDICKDKKTLALWKSNNRRAFKGETVEEEVSFKVKDEEKHYYNIISPIREKGKITGILGINVDITKRKQAEEALKRLNDELEQRVAERTTESQQCQLAFQNSQEAIFWVDPYTGVLVNCNKAAERILEKSRNEIIGKHVTTLHPAQEKERYKAMFTEHVTKGGTQSEEAIIVTRSGKRVPVHISSSLISVGDTTVIQGIFTDITERKKTEEELRLNNEMFKNVAEGIYLIGLDDGIIKWANARFEKMFGYEPGEMIGRYVSMVNAPTDKTPEETKREIVDILRKTGEWHGEVNNIKKDGTPFRCYANVSVFDHPEYGKVFVSVHTDITERKKTQKRLENSERKYRELVEEISDVIYSVDTKGNVVYISPAIKSLIGYEPHELIGRHFSDFVHSDDLQTMKDGFKSALAGRTTPSDYRLLNKAGSYSWVRALSKASKDNKNNIIGIRGVVSDITERKKVEEDIARQAKLLDLIFKYSLDSIVLLDKDYNFIWVSETYAKSCQRDSSEFAGHNHFEFYPSSLKEEFDAVKKGKSIYRQYARPFIFPDHPEWGETYWDLGLVPIFDDDGEIEMFLFTLKDITERMKSEEQLIQAEQRYRTVADFTYDWEWWRGPDGKYIYMSPSCERITGYKRDEFINNPHLVEEIILPEDQEEWRKHNIRAQTAYKPVEVQFRIKRKDGVIRWIEHACQPVKDVDGEFTGFRASNRDITDRRQVEDELRTSKNSLLKAQHIARMGFLTWNLKTNEMQWSDEVYRLYGVEKDKQEITLDFTISLVHPEDLEYVQKSLDLAIKGLAIYDINHRMIRPDGEVIWVHAMAELSRDKDGNPESLLGTVIDITNRRQMEEEANQLREEYLHMARVSAMGELTASLAHELKQPLAAIRSNSQAAQRFLAKEKPDLDELSEILVDIVKDNRRADEVIGRLRMLMRKSELQITELNINNVIQDIFPLVRSYEIMRNISLEFELDDKIPSVAGDRIQLQQVILNLIMNSSEALRNIAGDIRRIVIRTSQKNHNNVTVVIRDNGIGIDEQSLDSLFEPFYTTKQEGMGMGLPISRSIIEAHGGNLWAENNPDRGATFYFTIPLFQSSLA